MEWSHMTWGYHIHWLLTITPVFAAIQQIDFWHGKLPFLSKCLMRKSRSSSEGVNPITCRHSANSSSLIDPEWSSSLLRNSCSRSIHWIKMNYHRIRQNDCQYVNVVPVFIFPELSSRVSLPKFLHQIYYSWCRCNPCDHQSSRSLILWTRPID